MPKAPTTDAADATVTLAPKKAPKKDAPSKAATADKAAPKADKAAPKKAPAKKATAVDSTSTPAPKDGVPKKAPKKDADAAPKQKSGFVGRSPEHVLATLQHFSAKGKAGDVRSEARKATGNKNLGTPWLVKQGFLEEKVQENSKENLFIITEEGKKALKDKTLEG